MNPSAFGCGCPLGLDMSMHPQQTRVTSAARSAMPQIHSRICCKNCWSSGPLTILATVFRLGESPYAKAKSHPG